MKVLILGGGGREHAVAWKLRSDDPSVHITAAPGNPGIEEIGRCVRCNPTDPAAVVALAEHVKPDLVFVGPEAPLAAGVADALSSRKFSVFGPTQAASQLEASKVFSKQIMLEHGIPTGGASWHADAAEAKRAIRVSGAPVVIKASGLAAGKGVIVANTIEEADDAVDRMMLRGDFGSAGTELLVEEFMEGEEISVFAVCDGEHFVLLPPAQDHKRLLDGDTGPNTGGMGAYSPVSVASPPVLQDVADRVIGPTLSAMRKRGTPFCGLLYCGMMLTEHGPRVVEYNCRFGDPETQVVLPILEQPLLELMLRASTKGGLGASADHSAATSSAVATVLAAPGYPDAPVVGGSLVLPDAPADVHFFHAGSARAPSGELISAGGRVVTVSAVAAEFATACRLSREYASYVELPNAQFRRDIGWREMARRARTS